MKKKFMMITIAGMLLAGCSEEVAESQDKVIFSSDFGKYYDNGMIYSTGNGMNSTARFLDYASLETAPLCAVPNCTHAVSESSCLAQVMGEHPIIVGDNVYYFTQNGKGGEIVETPEGPVFKMESKLMKASLESSETEVVCEFTDALPRINGGYAVIDNTIYFIGYDPDVNIEETGGASWGSGGGYDYMCSIDLGTGKYTNYGSICYVEDEYPAADNSSNARLYGYYNGKLYITYEFLKEYPELTSEGAPVGMPEFTKFVYEFDPKAKQLTESDMPVPMLIGADYYAYRDEEVQLMKIISGDDTYTTPMEYIEGVYNGKLFYDSQWCALGEDTVHSLGEEYENYEVVGYHDGAYVLFNNRKAIKLTEEELLALDKE